MLEVAEVQVIMVELQAQEDQAEVVMAQLVKHKLEQLILEEEVEKMRETNRVVILLMEHLEVQE